LLGSVVTLAATTLLLLGLLGGIVMSETHAHATPAAPQVASAAPDACLPPQPQRWHREEHQYSRPQPQPQQSCEPTQPMQPVAQPTVTVAIPTPVAVSEAQPQPVAQPTEQCSAPALTPQSVIVGRWQIQEPGSVTLDADYQADGTMSYTVAAAGASTALQAYQQAGLVLGGKYTFDSPDRATFSVTSATFQNQTSVDPQRLIGLQAVQCCQIQVQDQDHLVFQPTQGQAVQLTRISA
jgi:hypothetical protein